MTKALLETSSRIGSDFARLQQLLQDRWLTVDEFDGEERHILVVPSLSLDQEELQKIEGGALLRRAAAVLSDSAAKSEYPSGVCHVPSRAPQYCGLLPGAVTRGIPSSHARSRLKLFSTYDASRKPLTQKLLERPRLLAKIRRAMNAEKGYMTCFNTTHLEQELSLALNLPLLALDPDLLHWGTKSGSREIFSPLWHSSPNGQ